jgi:hypothetical protein
MMKTFSYFLLCTGLLLGATTTATALPILNVLDLEATSLAKITGTSQDGIINEWDSLEKITKDSLKTTIIQGIGSSVPFPYNVVDVIVKDADNDWSGSVYAGTLFWNGNFTNSEHWYGIGGETNYSALTAEATAQLDMRFTVKGIGAMIAADAHKETNGSLAFSVFDETDDTMIFDVVTQGSGFVSPDLYLTDGHTYQLYALCKIGPGSSSGRWGEFYWYNSPFTVKVPESSTLLLSITGLFLCLLHRRRSAL